jgi:glycosyltransferase involved in cell wall biosynthesis
VPVGESCRGGESTAAPSVSVIVPAYNCAAFIAEALESVFAQTFRDFEVLVINDGSPDTMGLEKAIEPYRQEIRYIQQENRGPSAARNLGIQNARGHYVAFLDADDSWLSGFLAAQMRLFDEVPPPDLVFADVIIHGDTSLAGRTHMELEPPHGPAVFESLLVEDCCAPTSTVVARRQVLIECGLFDESLWRAEDFDLWLRVAHSGKRIAYQRKVLARHRAHVDALSHANTEMKAGMIRVLRKVERTLPLGLQAQELCRKKIALTEAQLQLDLGKEYLWARDFRRASDSLAKASAVLSSFRLRLALSGLRVAPRLARHTFTIWDRLLRASARLRANWRLVLKRLLRALAYWRDAGRGHPVQ